MANGPLPAAMHSRMGGRTNAFTKDSTPHGNVDPDPDFDSDFDLDGKGTS